MTVVGVLALVEALVRYGVRGVPVSAVPVTLVALVWPQRDLGGATLDPAAVLAIATLVCGLTLVVRETGRRSARALAAASQGFAEATLHLPLGVGVLDADGRVVQANPALVALLGPDLEGRRLRDRLRETGDALNPVLDGRSPDEPVDAETVDGRWLQLGACTLQAPGPVRTVVHARDITAERQERADLLHASRHDALTGLLVRSAGERVLQDALRAGSTAVLFLDMDGFKRLNDTAGHSVGDVVLEQAGSRLAAALRPSEVPVRWGGDEFVVVCRHVDDGDVLDSIAERLLGVLREPFRVDDRPLVTLTASVGAVLASPGQSPATALAAADHAMYLAKAAGGDRCVRWPAGAPPVPSPRSSSRAETADR